MDNSSKGLVDSVKNSRRTQEWKKSKRFIL